MQAKTMIPRTLAGLLLALTVIPAWSQDEEKASFASRCGQCHADAGSVTVPQRWLDRLGSYGSIDELTAEEQKELLSFFQHHGQDSATEVVMAHEQRLFQEKCSLCHNPNRVFLEPLDDDQLETIIERMRSRAPNWISSADADAILGYLRAGAPGRDDIERKDFGDNVQGLYRNRCSACHTLERVYLMLERDRDNAQWALTVKRMQARAPGWINDAEADQIIGYLETLKPQLPEGQILRAVE